VSARARLVVSVLAIAASGCAMAKPLVAGNDDLADYTAFRMAAHEGTRLARAESYLEGHPRGEWEAEVRAAFEEEEPAYFERATASRKATSEYLASLPRGPHATAAIALLTAFDAKVEDFEVDKLLRAARKTESTLEHASQQRRAVGERILADIAALLDPNAYGVPVAETPIELRRGLRGPVAPTWGALRRRRDDELFFSVPAERDRESRIAGITFAITIERGEVTEGRIEGHDLFVRWTEADEMRALDEGDPDDRDEARTHVRDLLTGALEARLPGEKCGVPPGGDAVLERACDGWSLIVRMGQKEGAMDAIVIRGPNRVRSSR
jgi:hypothetical protein